MPWDNEAEQGLPPQHHREPGSLRRDIVDELADHLACAADRETEAGDEEDETIRTRVLNQFGDPATVARSLWWDAMKENVMRDRVQFALIVVLCLSFLGFMGFFYQQMQTSNSSMMATNQAIMSALNERPTMAEELYPSVKVQMNRGLTTGPAAGGIEVTLSGKAFNEENTKIKEVTDSNGALTIGPIRAGTYHLSFLDPVTNMASSMTVTLYSGEGEKMYPITAPDSQPKSVAFKLPAMGRVDESQQAILVTVREQLNTDLLHWVGVRQLVLDQGQLLPVEYVRSKSGDRKIDYRVFKRAGRTNISAYMVKSGATTDFFGKTLRVQTAEGVFKYSGSDEFSYYGVRSREKNQYLNDLVVKSDPLSDLIELSGSNEIVLPMTEDFIEAYGYFTRSALNGFGDYPDEFDWFSHDINRQFPDWVIHTVARVGKSHVAKQQGSDPTHFLLSKPDRSSRTYIGDDNGCLFSTENFPTSVPLGGRVLLAFLFDPGRLQELKTDLGFFPIPFPLEYDGEGVSRRFHLDVAAGAKYHVAAEDLPKKDSELFTLDVTEWALSQATSKKTAGVLVMWAGKTENEIGLYHPMSNDEVQPVWIVLKPYDDGLPE